MHTLFKPDIEAVRWRERMAALPEAAGVRAELERWLESDPANAEAYARVEQTLALARAARDVEAIVDLRRETAARVSRRSTGPWRAAAIAASLAVVAFGGLLAWRAFEDAPIAAQVYATGPGERATLTLQDGSTVVLNTRSRVRTRYSRGERRLYLEAGEAVFEVAKDKQRAFVVLAGGQSVTAHGTAFDVHLKKGAVDVALLEGVVVVKPEAGSQSKGTRLSPGQMLTVQGGAATLTQIRKLDQVASWREGLVFFDDVTLSEAVAEMNRYAVKPLRLADTSLGSLRLSGSFRTDGAEAFAEALELYFPVRAIHADDASIVLAARR